MTSSIPLSLAGRLYIFHPLFALTKSENVLPRENSLLEVNGIDRPRLPAIKGDERRRFRD